MQIARTRTELKDMLQEAHRSSPGMQIGIVPTMGYLHEGHLELVQAARAECDFVIVSIFVNPLQFNEASDFEKYPVDLDRDFQLCQDAGVDLVFQPTPDDMYPRQPLLKMEMPDLTFHMCGEFRPGHFEGVLIVVARLLLLSGARRAYFGKKDYQQYKIIDRMVSDLEIPVTIVGVATMREESGVAMSSRNARLSPTGLEHASLIYRGMQIGAKAWQEGTHSIEELKEIIKDVIESGSLNQVEYLEIIDPDDLSRLTTLNNVKHYVIATAVFCEGVRLIDNIEVIDSDL